MNRLQRLWNDWKPVSRRVYLRDVTAMRSALHLAMQERDHWKAEAGKQNDELTRVLTHVVKVALIVQNGSTNNLRMQVAVPMELMLAPEGIAARELARHVASAIERQLVTADLARVGDYRAEWQRREGRWEYGPLPPVEAAKETT